MIQSNQIDKSTLIEFESRFNRLFRLDSSGRINRRDESDSKSRSKTTRFWSEFESNSNLYRKWSNLIIIVDLYCRFRYKLTFLIIFNQFLIKFDYSRNKFEVRFEFGPRSQIGIVATIDRPAGIESKKSIKSRFEFD